MVLLYITIVFLLLYALLIIFYSRSWRSLKDFKPAGTKDSAMISVIVAARNEESNILSLLDSLQLQTFPSNMFEVIVVDDYSTDDTASLVKKHRITNLVLLQPPVPAELSSKKKAIGTGISKAKGELIVTTDADCSMTPLWLQTINDFYSEKKAAFIAAPVKFSHDGSLLEIFQALDFMTLQGITAASVASGMHSMCNGANLAYQKQSFINVNGFEGIDHVATGDDMLLMHKIWKAEPAGVHYLKSQEAIVTTPPMKTWKEFMMQRKRWASKTLVYDDYRIIAVLVFVFLFNALFIVLLVAAFIEPGYWWYVGGYLAAKTIIEIPFIYQVAKFYGEKKLLPWFVLLQPLHIWYMVLAGFISQFGTYEWKGRKTK